MASLSNLTDIDLEKQVAALSRELAGLKKTLARRGSSYYEDGRDAASDYFDDIAGRVGRNLPALRQQAKAVEKSAREHPATTAAVGLLALGLVTMLLLAVAEKVSGLRFRKDGAGFGFDAPRGLSAPDGIECASALRHQKEVAAQALRL